MKWRAWRGGRRRRAHGRGGGAVVSLLAAEAEVVSLLRPPRRRARISASASAASGVRDAPARPHRRVHQRAAAVAAFYKQVADVHEGRPVSVAGAMRSLLTRELRCALAAPKGGAAAAVAGMAAALRCSRSMEPRPGHAAGEGPVGCAQIAEAAALLLLLCSSCVAAGGAARGAAWRVHQLMV